MIEVVFTISPENEEYISEQLVSSGFTAFYLEKSGDVNLIKIYTESVIPECLEKLIPVSSGEVNPESWSRKWGESYKGSEITADIYVLPAGMEPPAQKYRTIISIDPYDSFGDGHHPTTRLCVKILETLISNNMCGVTPDKISMLDVGTGSGILSIIAWIMGIRNIKLFDYDPVSVEKSSKNLEINGIYSLKPFIADIHEYDSDEKFDIITANLLSKLLENNLVKLGNLLKPGGYLIVSGISTIWTEQMAALFRYNNFAIIEHRTLDGWNGFLLRYSAT